jgi:hypothetical protein
LSSPAWWQQTKLVTVWIGHYAKVIIGVPNFPKHRAAESNDSAHSLIKIVHTNVEMHPVLNSFFFRNKLEKEDGGGSQAPEALVRAASFSGFKSKHLTPKSSRSI